MHDENENLKKTFAYARYVFVYLFLLLLAFLNATNLSILDHGRAKPYFLLMGIYFWLTARPSVLPGWLVFLFGIFLDLITGQTVVGLNGLCFVLVYFILQGQQRYLSGQSWAVLWVGFGIASIFVSLIQMMVFMLMNWVWAGFGPVLSATLISVLAYPLVIVPMIAINRLFAK